VSAIESSDRREIPQDLFPTTIWTDVELAREKSQRALARLCERYHLPLFVYLRRRGLDEDAAADAVQGFFAHLLTREFLLGVRAEKGRFRAFLITCLKNYVRDEKARLVARKRGGGAVHFSLDADERGAPWCERLAAGNLPPDLAYDRAWAETVLHKALQKWRAEQAGVREEFVMEGLEDVMYQDADAPSIQALAERLGVSQNAVRMAAFRLRRRLAHWIREEVARTVATRESLEEEIRYLISVLQRT
jgi:DNA-directed RNA polymerase specialized sigma24 family protein